MWQCSERLIACFKISGKKTKKNKCLLNDMHNYCVVLFMYLSQFCFRYAKDPQRLVWFLCGWHWAQFRLALEMHECPFLSHIWVKNLPYGLAFGTGSLVLCNLPTKWQWSSIFHSHKFSFSFHSHKYTLTIL